SPYIDSRLRVVGYEGKGLFHRDAVQQIALYSKGIPRLINIICDNALLTAYAESKKIVSTHKNKEVATDLRIRSELQVTKAAPTPAVSVPKTERQVLVHKISDRVSEPKLRRLVSAGIGTFLGILAFVALASIIDPQN